MKSSDVVGPQIDFPFTIEGWADLSALIEYFSYYAGVDWLFRGEASRKHHLIPKVGRDTRKKRAVGSAQNQRVPYSKIDERAVFDMFVQQARGHLNSTYTSIEWLAIAQHFGVPTRLLDWTDTLLVAVWFATREQKEDARVWVTADTLPVGEGDTDPFKIDGPRVYRPPHISPRIAAQGSVLMVCPEPNKPLKLVRLEEIVIPRSCHFELQKRLNACGVNRRALFSDLQGLGDHLAWLYKNDWLAGYKYDVLAVLMNTGSFKELPEQRLRE